MGRAYVKKRIKKLKELAEKETDGESKELLMIFHDVFKFLVERATPRGTEATDLEEEIEE
jgi:hypothetical protein